MPVSCPFSIPRLSQEEFGSLDYDVMRQVFAAHKDLGSLCDESVYQTRLSHLLTTARFQVECEVPVTVSFRTFIKTLSLDLVVNRRAIYELKTVKQLTETHSTQLLNYLFLTNAARGKLINFRPSSVESKFVNSTMDDKERRRFTIDESNWRGHSDFRQMIEELVADWGTGLDQSLYTQAVVHCLGGDETVTRQVPMQLDGIPLGNQRFHIFNADTAFRITTFQNELGNRHQLQLRRLIALSQLTSLYWVNIGRHELSLRTIEA